MHLQTKISHKKVRKRNSSPAHRQTEHRSDNLSAPAHLCGRARTKNVLLLFSRDYTTADFVCQPLFEKFFLFFSIRPYRKNAQIDQPFDITDFCAVSAQIFSQRSDKKRNFGRIKSSFLTIYKAHFSCYNFNRNARRHLFGRSINLMIPPLSAGHSPCFFLCYIIKL